VSQSTVLSLEGVTRTIGARTILRGIDAHVDRGEFVSLVGPSGCGKSTLLYIVGGFTDHRDYQGSVRVDGQLSQYPNWEKGIIFQKNVLYPWLNVLDNIAYGMVLRELGFVDMVFRRAHYKRAWQQYRERAREYLAKMCMNEADGSKMIYEISGGMQQRVDIASALMLRPKIMMMDEPFSGLDPQTRAVLQVLLRKVHREEGNTILFVTHDLEEAVYCSTRVIVLSQFHDQGPGAKVVLDQRVPFHASADPRLEPGFQELVEKIRRAGFSREDTKTIDAATQGTG
jgi:ABC-type nitrate/sulfonate/bicarbonate transport system ATPase subunit